jgi:hypothetical protein
MNAPVIQSKQSRKKFDKTFKRHAVELWLNSGKAATEVAAELGINPQRLGAWRTRFAPNNWNPKMPGCGARTIICGSSGIF